MAGHSTQPSASFCQGLREVECPEPAEGLFFVYILQSSDGSFYVGQSNNVEERLRKHRLGLGSKHTHNHPGIRLVHTETFPGLTEAVRRERQLKRWSRAKKTALICGDFVLLKKLSASRQSE